MAISRSSYNNKVLYLLGLFSVSLLIQRGVAYEFKVGGSSGWSVPSDAQSYGQWAQKNRFKIGDTLLFEYSADKDSVLLVSQDHYTNCVTDEPLANFSNGHTIFKLNQSGPFFFISGTKANCLKNEKLHVIVLADRSGTKSSPSPSPTPILTPSPAPVPSEDEIPSPPSESIPSPPPDESTPSPAESTPSPATSSDEGQSQAHHKNGASPLVVSGVGLFGAFVGLLSIVLGF